MNEVLITCNTRWEILWGAVGLGLFMVWSLLLTLPDE